MNLLGTLTREIPTSIFDSDPSPRWTRIRVKLYVPGKKLNTNQNEFHHARGGEFELYEQKTPWEK